MIKPQQKRYSFKSLGRKQLQKDYSLSHLYTLNTKLENQKEKTKKMLEKMKQEQAISNKIGHTVGATILKVENDGVYFASRIQEEKRKNMLLTTLVAHYQATIENQKKSNYEQMIKTKKILKSSSSNLNTTFYESFKANTEPYAPTSNPNPSQTESSAINEQYCEQKLKQLKKLQKQYDQFVVKTNASEYELGRKLDQVRTLRSERTVFNKIFDQFQKEIFQHQFGFKQLVIQRSVLSASFQEKVNEFEKLNAQAEKQFEKLLKNQKLKSETQKILDQISTKRDINLYANEQASMLQFRGCQDVQRQKRCLTMLPINRTTCIESVQNIPLRQSLPQTQQNDSSKKILLNSPQKKVNFKLNTSQNHNSRLINHCQSIFSRQYQQQQQKQRSPTELQSRKLDYQKKVKEIYEELKIDNCEDLPGVLVSLDSDIGDLYAESERLYEILYQKEKKIGKFPKSRMFRKNGYNQMGDGNDCGEQEDGSGERMRKKVNIKQKIQQYTQQQLSSKAELANFYSSQLTKIQTALEPPSLTPNPTQTQYNTESLRTKILQIEQILSFLSPQPFQFQIDETILTDSNQTKQKQDQDQPINPSNYNYSKRDTYRSGYNQFPSLEMMGNLTYLSNCGSNSANSGYGYNKLETRVGKEKEKDRAGDDSSRLEMILKQNKTTENNITIYSQEELVKISRYYLDDSRRVIPGGGASQQTALNTSLKSYRDKNQSKTKNRDRQTGRDHNDSYLSYSRQNLKQSQKNQESRKNMQ